MAIGVPLINTWPPLKTVRIVRLLSARRSGPRGGLFPIPGGHYQSFLDGHEQAVQAGLSFLRRHLLDHAPPDAPATRPD